MNERIIYSQNDGSVAVIIPAPECGLTAAEIAAKDVPDGTPYEIVSVADIPSDRTFRNAWIKQGASVVHDLPKAKLIAHDRRRAARAAEFAPLDIQATIPSQAAQAEAQRQAIRDKYAVIQTQIDAAANIPTLKTIVDSF